MNFSLKRKAQLVLGIVSAVSFGVIGYSIFHNTAKLQRLNTRRVIDDVVEAPQTYYIRRVTFYPNATTIPESGENITDFFANAELGGHIFDHFDMVSLMEEKNLTETFDTLYMFMRSWQRAPYGKTHEYVFDGETFFMCMTADVFFVLYDTPMWSKVNTTRLAHFQAVMANYWRDRLDADILPDTGRPEPSSVVVRMVLHE